jgi:hypothetical protein
MITQRKDDGSILTMRRVEGPDGIVGHGMVTLRPGDDGYAELDSFLREREEEGVGPWRLSGILPDGGPAWFAWDGEALSASGEDAVAWVQARAAEGAEVVILDRTVPLSLDSGQPLYHWLLWRDFTLDRPEGAGQPATAFAGAWPTPPRPGRPGART